jgi:hypothetical protein
MTPRHVTTERSLKLASNRHLLAFSYQLLGTRLLNLAFPVNMHRLTHKANQINICLSNKVPQICNIRILISLTKSNL